MVWAYLVCGSDPLNPLCSDPVPGNLHRNIIDILHVCHTAVRPRITPYILLYTFYTASHDLGHYHGTSTRHISSHSTCTHSLCVARTLSL